MGLCRPRSQDRGRRGAGTAWGERAFSSACPLRGRARPGQAGGLEPPSVLPGAARFARGETLLWKTPSLSLVPEDCELFLEGVRKEQASALAPLTQNLSVQMPLMSDSDEQTEFCRFWFLDYVLSKLKCFLSFPHPKGKKH